MRQLRTGLLLLGLLLTISSVALAASLPVVIPGDITIVAAPPPVTKDITVYSDAALTSPLVKFWLGTEVVQGATINLTVYVKNNGTAAQPISVSGNMTWGSVSATSVSIPAGASTPVPLVFQVSPTASGRFDNWAVSFGE